MPCVSEKLHFLEFFVWVTVEEACYLWPKHASPYNLLRWSLTIETRAVDVANYFRQTLNYAFNTITAGSTPFLPGRLLSIQFKCHEYCLCICPFTRLLWGQYKKKTLPLQHLQ